MVRPKPTGGEAAVTLLARAYTEEAIQGLAEIMRNGDSCSVRLAAIKEILERGWSKPAAVGEGMESELKICLVDYDDIPPA